MDPAGRPIADLPPDSQAVVRAADGTVAVSGFHRSGDPGNGAHHVDLFVWSAAQAGTYRIALTAVEIQQGRFDAWIERTDPQRQSRFAAANATPDRTTGSICNGWLPLAVGAYDSRDPHHPPAHFSSRVPRVTIGSSPTCRLQATLSAQRGRPPRLGHPDPRRPDRNERYQHGRTARDRRGGIGV